MPRATTRATIAGLVAPELEPGEEVLGTATVWAARRGRVPLLFTGRHLHRLAFTDRRVLVFERRGRKRGTEPVVDEPLGDLALAGARAFVPMYRVLADAPDGRRFVFDFRLRDRATGRALVRLLDAGRAEP